MLSAIREARGSLAELAELIQAARAYCAAMDEYDRKANPFNLRRMSLARERMRHIYRGDT